MDEDGIIDNCRGGGVTVAVNASTALVVFVVVVVVVVAAAAAAEKLEIHAVNVVLDVGVTALVIFLFVAKSLLERNGRSIMVG